MLTGVFADALRVSIHKIKHSKQLNGDDRIIPPQLIDD